MAEVDIKEALKGLAEHANAKGGTASASEAEINVPLKAGETLAVVKFLPNGQAEVLYPFRLTREVGFGRYYVGAFLLKLVRPELTA